MWCWRGVVIVVVLQRCPSDSSVVWWCGSGVECYVGGLGGVIRVNTSPPSLLNLFTSIYENNFKCICVRICVCTRNKRVLTMVKTRIRQGRYMVLVALYSTEYHLLPSLLIRYPSFSPAPSFPFPPLPLFPHFLPPSLFLLIRLSFITGEGHRKFEQWALRFCFSGAITRRGWIGHKAHWKNFVMIPSNLSLFYLSY